MKVLIIGRARGNWEEVEAAKALGSFDQTICINSAGVDYPEPFDHWVSFHVLNFPAWTEQRAQKGYFPVPNYWSTEFRGSVRSKIPGWDRIKYVRVEGGASGLIAVMVALRELRATRVVLAGIPMTPEAGHYNEEGPWRECIHHRGSWQFAEPDMNGIVRSMSGWTQELLGVPTKAWLEQRKYGPIEWPDKLRERAYRGL